MAHLGPIYQKWITDLEAVWEHNLAEVTTEVNPANPTVSNGFDTQIEVCATDTISAVLAEHSRDKNKNICILNFSSYKTPGGGFTRGAYAQEEAICYCTNLYPNLLKNWQWYESHKKTMNGGAYSNECLVSHNITVLASEPGKLLPEKDRFTIDVITCAAPNWSRTLRYFPDDQEQLDKLSNAAFDRVQYVMQVLSGYKYDTIILGAFGCGVFKNDPEAIAEAFYFSLTELLPNVFNRVLFAIPDSSSYNYRTFAKQFAENKTAGCKTDVFNRR